MKKIFLLLFLGVCLGRVAAQTSSPSVNTFTSCTQGNQTCSFGTVKSDGTIKAAVTSLNSTSATFKVQPCSISGTFGSGGTMYVKSTVCTTNPLGNQTYSSGVSSISVTINHNLSAGASGTFYVTLTSASANNYYYAGPFTITMPPALVAPVPTTPTDGQSFPYTQTSVTCQWNKNNGSGIASYEFRLVNLTTGATIIDYLNLGDVSSYTTSNLQPGTQYRWVVRAVRGSEIAQSTTFPTFTIAGVPAVAAPTATSPSSPTVYSSVPSTILFAWNKNNNAGLCDYIINLRDLTDNVLILDDNLGNAGDNSSYNYVSTGLIAGHNYRWVIKARNRLNSSDIRTTGDQLFNITIPATVNLSLASAMSFGSTNLTVGQTYTFTTSIKNTGNAAWSGNLVLKINGADAASRGGFSVPAGGTTPVSLSYPATTSAIGNNLPTQLFYVTGGVPPGSLIAAGTFQNPITINILAPATTCSGCVQWTNGTTLTSDNVFCLATKDLCTRQIIISEQNSANNFYKGIQRKDLAVLVFKALFGSNQQATTPASNFPVPFMDMRNATGREYWYNAAKTLAYLQFSDETTPFDRTFKNFRPNDSIVRKAGLKVIMEAWNLHPEAQDLTSPQVFTDVSQSSNLYGYVQKAARLGIITGNNNCGTGPCFNPAENMTRNQAFTIIYRLLNKLNGSGLVNPSIPNAPTSVELQNAANYYVPFNVTMANLANLPDMSQGNFNHYTKSSFSIAGRGFPLAFEHSYNSFLTEMPDSFFVSQSSQNLAPLGIGWTHSYNSYIQKVEGYTDVSETGANITVDPKFLIAWADGSFQSYDRGTNAYDTEGVYDDLKYTSGATEAITITTKNQMTYRFESSANLGHFSLVSIKDRNNNGLSLTYNSSKQLQTVRETYANGTSNNNRSLVFAYLGDFLSSVTDNSLTPNRVIQFTVNATEKDLESFVDATSKTTTYTYGLRSSVIDNHLGDHLLTTITLPKGNTITNSYFQRKLTSTKTNPNGAHASRPSTTTVNWQNKYAANVANEFTKSTVTTTQNGGSLVSEYSHDVQGRVKTANTPTSNVAVSAYGTGQNVYKPQNVMVTPTRGGTSSTVAMSYDPQGNVKEVQRTYTEGGVLKTLISGFTYTALNDIKTATDARGNTTTLVYGDNKNLSEIRRPLGSTTTITRNPYFQIASVTNPEGIVTNYEYNDANGNLSRTFIQSTNPLIASSATYDGASRVKTTTDPENKTTAVDYDNNDNVLWERDHLQSTTRYDYDANDNLRHITDALQQATEFVYSTNEDFLLSESFGGQTKNYTYNEDGSLKTFTRGSRNFAFTYNTLGQMTADGQTTLTYDNRNRIATSTYQNRVIQYFYDDLDRMTAYEYTANGRTNRVEYTYDENSNVRTIKYAPNRVVTYTYDALNRMKTVTDWNGIVVARYEYKLDGRMDYVLYNNGVRTTYAYETASGRMNGLTVKKSTNETIAAYTFGLDKVGNHTTEQITEPLLPTALSSITNKNISGATYEYNRIKQYGDRNFGVDNLGNVATEGSTTNTFDVYDNLTAVAGTNAMTAEYDASGMRRQLTQNGTTTRYVLDIMGMGNILMETDANGNPQNYYIHGATGLICRLKADATTTHYYHGDFRSSIVAMTDANQNITHKYAYDPFGTLIGVAEPANDSNPFRYVGQQGVMFDAPNRYFMRARYYDPSVGRFVSEDPIWDENLYPYANNNPVNSIDPSGTKAKKKGSTKKGKKDDLLEVKAEVSADASIKEYTGNYKGVELKGSLGNGSVAASINKDGISLNGSVNLAEGSATYYPTDDLTVEVSGDIGGASVNVEINSKKKLKVEGEAHIAQATVKLCKVTPTGDFKIEGGAAAGSIDTKIGVSVFKPNVSITYNPMPNALCQNPKYKGTVPSPPKDPIQSYGAGTVIQMPIPLVLTGKK